MSIQPVVVGGTYDWFLNPAMINTEASPEVFGAWDLTGATVTISFVPPSGAGSHFTATIVSATLGTAQYTNTTALLNVAGTWGVSWKVSKSGIVLESQIYYFTVYASGAAT
jgi:hypothetical protein